MKKKIHFTLYILHGQNLVPNPSFEYYLNCPKGPLDIDGNVIPWSTQYVKLGSSDYLHVCSTNKDYGVPSNLFGFQYPRTGNAYVGIGTYTPIFTDAREYIQVALNDLLKPNKKYCVRFNVSLSDFVKYATDGMGAYFSDTAVYPSTWGRVLPFNPQVSNSQGNILYDTANWIPVSGLFTANGGEKYLTIGNFISDNNLNTFLTSWGIDSGTYETAYYYIDDVSVVEQGYADAGPDVIITAGDSVRIGVQGNYRPGITWNWSPSESLSDSTAALPWAKPTQTTAYTLSIQDTSGYNCLGKTSDTVVVYVQPAEHTTEPLLPTAFSPNGDGQNDLLYIRSKNIHTIHLTIYNRWGEQVFESYDQNSGWDGNHNGSPAPAGVYVWYLEAELIDGTTTNKQGNVTLVR